MPSSNKGFTPCRTVALFVEDNDVVALLKTMMLLPLPHLPIPPLTGIIIIAAPPARSDDDAVKEEDMLYWFTSASRPGLLTP